MMTLTHGAKPVLSSLGKHWQKRRSGWPLTGTQGWVGRVVAVLLLMNIEYTIRPFRCSRQVSYTLGNISYEIRDSLCGSQTRQFLPTVFGWLFFLFLRI